MNNKIREGKVSLGQLKMLADEVIAKLDMPYRTLDYSELRLLRKSDIKRMLLVWTKPAIQKRPRKYHSQRRQEFCHRYGTS